ncbi:MAG: hypothetical protein PHQ60_11735 [Sideroxydans sp.]|nr:hypothetical protein [Sideroxydans sp.]
MNREQVTRIIESALKSGDKTPGLFDLPKIMGIRSELQSCSSIDDVLGIIDNHKDLICKAFGLSEDVIAEAVEKIKALES